MFDGPSIFMPEGRSDFPKQTLEWESNRVHFSPPFKKVLIAPLKW
jgi:hypothetical protein